MTALVETERKRRITESWEAAHRRLISVGCTASPSVTETDVYYGRPDVDFMATRECLRVRARLGFAEITYKPPTTTTTHTDDGVVAKIETNVSLAERSESARAEQLMEALGMIRLATVEKCRRVYRHRDFSGATVSIDTVTNLGSFSEVEILADSGQDVTAMLVDVERTLGLDSYPVVEEPYRDLVMRGNDGR